jgi:hypothetical protein
LSRPRDFIRKAASIRRVPSKQGPPKGSFLNFLSSVSACAESGVMVPTGRPYCCASTSAQPKAIVIPKRSEGSWFLSAALLNPPQSRIPPVEIIWKSCGMRRLTGSYAARMFVKFRGQSDSHSCEFAWTEFAPLRRTAIRSLTTRLNVPVVRNGFGH